MTSFCDDGILLCIYFLNLVHLLSYSSTDGRNLESLIMKTIRHRNKVKNISLNLGPTSQKILLLLASGGRLMLSRRPDMHFRIIKETIKEWQKINENSLRRAIKRLYQSKLIDYKENTDGTITVILGEDGKQKALRYNLDKIAIPVPNKWDGLWRMIIFDVPESHRQGRYALMTKLKNIGFHSLQKSVYIFPYPCKDEIDFIVEFFRLRPYVRYVIVKEIDVELDLKHYFDLE